MGYDPANDARLRREEQRRQEGFRENDRIARETRQANERNRNAAFYKAMLEASNTYKPPLGPEYLAPARSTRRNRSGGEVPADAAATAGFLGGLWRLVSVAGGFAAGVVVWRAVYASNPASPWVAIGAGAVAGWISAKIIDSDLVRGLVKLAFYAAVVVGILWFIAGHGR